MELIQKYFPDLEQSKLNKLAELKPLYEHWNAQINVISRKDMDSFYERHVLHSLAIAKVADFEFGSKILDVGTGGGFPGIPLAIVFPHCEFVLADSIAKKIKVVNEVASALELQNVVGQQVRVENLKGRFDHIVSRAVTQMPKFMGWVRGKIIPTPKGVNLPHSIWYLKGGDLKQELSGLQNCTQYPISNFFEEEFFDTKKVVQIRY